MVAVRLRFALNLINLSTPLGLAVALAGGAELHRGPAGLVLATNYPPRFPAPKAPAVTIGNVVLLRLDQAELAKRPTLLIHEARHASQYAWCIGPVGFLPGYLIASAWSWLHTRNFARRNIFEVRAGLLDGGYLDPPEAPEGAEAPPAPTTPTTPTTPTAPPSWSGPGL